jgi:hypothetical protein
MLLASGPLNGCFARTRRSGLGRLPNSISFSSRHWARPMRLAASGRLRCRHSMARCVRAGRAGHASDQIGRKRGVGLDNISIIAPCDAQVFELQERLSGARSGTVDKFQGQEAPIAIDSTTTSNHADAPRGMEFFDSANCFNVAASRARCVFAKVGSPLLIEAECRKPWQVKLANAFCR